MALNEQMKEAIQADIADESSRKERLAKQIEGLKSTGKFIGETAVESVPGVSEAIAAKNVSRDLEEGDYVGAGIETVAGLAGLAPAGDIVAKGLRKFNKTRKAYKLFVKSEDDKLYPLFVDADKEIKRGEFLEANFPDAAFKGKRSATSKESFYVPTKGAKRSKGEKRKKTGTDIIIPDEETRQKLINDGFITERAGRTKQAPFGKVTAVAARPGFHASQSPVATHLGPEDLKITKKEADKLIKAGVTPEAIIRKGKQLSVKRRAEDQVFAEVDMADDVDYQSMLAKEGRSDINDRVPKGGSYRYSDGQADSDQWVVGGDMKVNRVLSREETRAIQKEMGVTDLPYRDEVESILGRKFAKGGMVMDDYLVAKTMDQTQNFAKGGMSKQMELFEPVEGAFDEGGLMDEGGSVDPESGNDVPVGSTQEEVRDDIPAQLSEGEFVLPADVVRFHGLEKIMALRDEAKAGLAKMEAMGQMGNSDEATIPDGIPFSMDDLEMEDDGVQDFAQGGVVQAQAGTFVMPQTNPTQASQFTGYQPQYTPYTPPAMPAATAGYTPPMQQATPVSTTATPTFTGLTGIATPSTGGYDEMKTYVNDAGMEMQIPFKDGSPIYPIPEGFKVKTEEVETATTTTTTGTGVDTSQSSSDEDSAPPKYTTTDPTGIGYNRAKVKSTALKDVLTESAKSQMRSFFSNSLMSTAGKELGLVGTKMTSSAVLGGILDDFREGNVSFETGLKEGSYTNTVNLESLTKEQGDIIADVFKSVSEKMSGLYTDQDEVTGEEINLKPAEVNARVVDMAKELDIKTTVGDTENTKRRETLEREIATELARREKKETSKQAAMETGEQRREEQKQAAADASKYGISATRADGSRKSTAEIRSEIADAVTAQALEKERQAAERRSQRGDSDDSAPDQSTYAGSQAYGAETFGISGLAKGGLVEQMKQSGLASKK
jgi:hypothetical protein